MIEVDGSAGGGQLLRTAVTLSALSGEAVHVTEVRSARPNPGLRPQHLAAVRAVAAACGAEVTGDEVGADEVTFRPGHLEPGAVEVEVGTAGSVTLVFDTVLPLALGIDGVLSVRATGGTDVAWAPTLDYYRLVKLPLLRRAGLAAAIDLDRRGFFPVGGGSATLQVAPSTPEPFGLGDRGRLLGAQVAAIASDDLADREVAERGVATAVEGLREAGIETVSRTAGYADATSTGAAACVCLAYGRTLAGFDALGEPGVPMEEVADEAVEAATTFASGSAAVDAHLADQLVVFLALAGGRVAIPAMTPHVETCLGVVSAFGYDVSVESASGGPVLVGR